VARCSRSNASLVSTATALCRPPGVRSDVQTSRTPWRPDVEVLGIIGAVFQLIGDILGFVGSILNAVL
jgi:hypothetical protein